MSPPRPAAAPRSLIATVILGALVVGGTPLTAAPEAPLAVAVYAATSPDYHRVREADGTFKRESYAFGEGGFSPGNIADPTIDRLSFRDVIRQIAPALAIDGYVPCDPKKPGEANLLIMVYWGVTVGTDSTSSSVPYAMASSLTPPPMPPPSPTPDGNFANGMTSDPSMSGRRQAQEMRTAEIEANDAALQQSLALTQMANAQRDRQDAHNAAILGYQLELSELSDLQGTVLDQRRRDVLADVEESRYYVILLAYDFQHLLKHKQRKMLWETRYSLPARHAAFDQALAQMSRNAAKFFGQSTDRRIRETMPNADVIVGPLREVTEPGKAKD